MRDLPENYNYKAVTQSLLLAQLYSKEDVEKWIFDLQSLTKETWTIKRTFKVNNTSRNIFKRIYGCHFNTSFKRKADSKPKKSKNIDCPARLIITIKKIYKRSHSKATPSVSNRWPCILEFKSTHNHELNVAETLKERPIGDAAKQRLLELYRRGHSPASAYHTFYMDIIEEVGDDYENIIIDRYFMPTKSDVSNYWKKFVKEIGDCSESNTGLLKLEEILSKHKEANNVLYKIASQDDNHAISICTPLMQRTLEKAQVGEIMFVDAVRRSDGYDNKVYFFAIQTLAGGLPIGCIVTNCEEDHLFNIAVSNLLYIMPKKIEPSCILTDGDLEERKALQAHWPHSPVFLCTSYVLKSTWRWISRSKNRVPKDLAQKFYKFFKSILYARTQYELDAAKDMLFKNCSHEKFEGYVRNFLNREKTWCIFTGHDMLIKASNTSNHAEIVFRLLKNVQLERAKAFSLVQLTDYIIVCYDNYCKQRVLDLIKEKKSKVISEKYLPSSTDEQMVVEYVDMLTLEFSVTCRQEDTTSVTYYVDMQARCCTCMMGFSGSHCKHQGAVLRDCNFLCPATSTLPLPSKEQLYEVVTGTLADERTFLSKEELEELAANELDEFDMLQDLDPDDALFDDDPAETEEASCESSQNSNSCNVSKSANEVKTRWKKFSNFLLDSMDKDPENYAPAVAAFLENMKKFAPSKTALLSGLRNAFVKY